MISANHLHAIVIHFPIALLLVGFLSQTLSLLIKKEFFNQVAYYLLILGTLGVIVAYLSGDAAGEGIEEGPLKLPMELHEQAATVTLWLAIIASCFRAGIGYFQYKAVWSKWLSFYLFACVAISVGVTGYYGGQLVYKHGAGVELALPDFNNTSEE